MESTKIINNNLYSTSTFTDYPDPDSTAVMIYFLGCEHGCVDCYNRDIRDYYCNINTQTITANKLFYKVLDLCKKERTNKVVFTGGDPLYVKNREVVSRFLSKCVGVLDVCIYTGYNIEAIKKMGLFHFTFIKSGEYDRNLKQESKKTNSYIQFASKNQILYDKNLQQVSKDGRYYFKK